MEQFEEFVENATAQLHHLLVEQLLSVEDFQTFKAMMVKRNVQQNLQALQADDAATGDYAGEDGSQVRTRLNKIE